MTRDDVIRMAREAGFDMPEMVATTDSDWHYREVAGMWKRVDRLIEIAKAAEREACIKAVETLMTPGYDDNNKWFNNGVLLSTVKIKEREK